MPTTQTSFAWAVEVKVHKLGASLEAYHRLQPTFSTLRLCNRFGHGEKAAVNKLPVELVQQVEDLMMQEERAQTSRDWARDFVCWQSSCKPIDHYDKTEILDRYNSFHVQMEEWDSEGSHCGCCGGHLQGYGFQPRTKVTKQVRDWVIEHLEDLYAEGIDDGWLAIHEQRVEDWCKRAGSPTASSRGMFDKLAKVLERDFGLRVWISHTVECTSRPEYISQNVAQSTKAYLHLPGSSPKEQVWETVVADLESSPRRDPTESGSAYAVNIPKKPSKASLARFDRALKILGLKACSRTQTTSTSKAPASAGNQPNAAASAEDDQPNAAAPHPPKSRCKPKLTMFVRNCVESDWW